METWITAALRVAQCKFLLVALVLALPSASTLAAQTADVPRPVTRAPQQVQPRPDMPRQDGEQQPSSADAQAIAALRQQLQQERSRRSALAQALDEARTQLRDSQAEIERLGRAAADMQATRDQADTDQAQEARDRAARDVRMRDAEARLVDRQAALEQREKEQAARERDWQRRVQAFAARSTPLPVSPQSSSPPPAPVPAFPWVLVLGGGAAVMGLGLGIGWRLARRTRSAKPTLSVSSPCASMEPDAGPPTWSIASTAKTKAETAPGMNLQCRLEIGGADTPVSVPVVEEKHHERA